jgi:branched-subunit amino acid transport protein AzlD
MARDSLMLILKVLRIAPYCIFAKQTYDYKIIKVLNKKEISYFNVLVFEIFN